MESSKKFRKLVTPALLAALFAGGLLATGCSGDSAGTGDAPSTTPKPGADTNTSPFYVQVTWAYEGTEIGGTLGECYYEATDPLGSAMKTCTLRLPELTLHYSDLRFRVGTASATTCEQISFRPYSYLRSLTNPYGPDDTDCTKADSKKCWGGAGPDMIEGWPKVGSYYFLPINQLSSEYPLRSSNKRGMDSTEGSNVLKYSNADTSNMLPLAARGTTQTIAGGDKVDYVQNTWQDYYFSCRDKWANVLYSITIKIADDDTVVAGHDDAVDYYYDWNDP